MSKLLATSTEHRIIDYKLGPNETVPHALVTIGGYFKKENIPDRLEYITIHIQKPKDVETSSE